MLSVVYKEEGKSEYAFMEKRTVYLDNAATTKPFEEVVKEINKSLLDVYGNPSSVHRMGIEAEEKLKKARETIARSLQVNPSGVFFTSGGTEANNLALKGTARALRRKGTHIIVSATEHKSVLSTIQALDEEGFEITYLPVDSNGFVDLDKLAGSIRRDTILVSIMHVNNETGVIQPIDRISEILRDKHSQAQFHVDAVQSYGKIPLHPKQPGIDLLTLSGHKIHGPKGVGALYLAGNSKLNPILHGGNQENGMRAGTENLPAIAGFAKAAEINFRDIPEKENFLRDLNNRFQSKLQENIKELRINTPEDLHAAPHILNVSFPGLKGEVLLRQLELEGVYVSTGSACTSGDKRPSHVLGAMGIDRTTVEGALRFSFSVMNKPEEIDYAVEALIPAIKKLRKMAKLSG